METLISPLPLFKVHGGILFYCQQSYYGVPKFCSHTPWDLMSSHSHKELYTLWLIESLVRAHRAVQIEHLYNKGMRVDARPHWSRTELLYVGLGASTPG